MREISIASQISLEKSYVKMLMKAMKGVAQRRFERETMRNHYHAWRHKKDNKKNRAVLQRAFRLLLKVTTRRLQTIFENWAWEAGRTRSLDRKCHLLATGRSWPEEVHTITSSASRNLRATATGAARPRPRICRASCGSRSW